tara:strand:+ start:40 stop:633 length:594 start_codon:yes stop_codon:yes gene_type:complete
MEINNKRYEIKFLISGKEKNNFIIKNNLKCIFPDRIVESIYFDTNDFKFFHLSEEGITPRKKIRIRGYNNNKLDNLEVKITNNYFREKITFNDFNLNDFKLHSKLKKIGINEIVEKKIRIKYLRSYFLLKDIGRITIDRNIEFFKPSLNFSHSKKIDEIVLEVKIQNDKFDKNDIEKIINFREIRYSKYCNGINRLY